MALIKFIIVNKRISKLCYVKLGSMSVWGIISHNEGWKWTETWVKFE